MDTLVSNVDRDDNTTLLDWIILTLMMDDYLQKGDNLPVDRVTITTATRHIGTKPVHASNIAGMTLTTMDMVNVSQDRHVTAGYALATSDYTEMTTTTRERLYKDDSGPTLSLLHAHELNWREDMHLRISTNR